ncbi:Cubilin [Mizuhopecten yessoensis]|uniref:Cubilin n=1 Tax=Mizuhopecten yessoensis TaxID=6573 RepID=A0A210PSL5_MIZYE|nr:Cubilin [Mizuhopecten yessoensis]
MEAWIPYLHFCVIVPNIYKVVAQCGGSITTIDASETYKIHTLQYPGSGTYGENLNCSWILHSSTNELLLYLSVHQLTNGDVLYIYDGMTAAVSPLFSTSTSGTSGLSITVVAPSGASYLRFTSNSVAGTSQLGFTVRYMSAVTDDKGGCASTVNVEATDTIQYLTSPNFPGKYPRMFM